MNQSIANQNDFLQPTMQAVDAGTHQAAIMLGLMAKEVWITSWPYVIFYFLIFLTSKFLNRGIGSVIYHTIFLGIFLIIIAFEGFDIIFNPYFDAIYALVYLTSFRLTGFFLKKIKQKARGY